MLPQPLGPMLLQEYLRLCIVYFSLHRHKVKQTHCRNRQTAAVKFCLSSTSRFDNHVGYETQCYTISDTECQWHDNSRQYGRCVFTHIIPIDVLEVPQEVCRDEYQCRCSSERRNTLSQRSKEQTG